MLSIETIIERVAGAFAGARGVVAVALGGSRARGWARPDSDIDLGLYYRGGVARLDPAALSVLAATLDDARRPGLASPHGGWGAWMDGGAWLTVEGVAVDLIYRDLDRVDAAIDAARRGEFQTAYHFGHPHGFVSAAYAGELAVCRALHDPGGVIAAGRAWLDPYPEALRATLIRRFLDEAGFTLPLLAKAEARGDALYAAGLAFRVAACLCQTLFALNRTWLINEKGAPDAVARLALKPERFAERAAAATYAALAALEGEVRALT